MADKVKKFAKTNKERNYSCHLVCSVETRELILNDCIKEFLVNNQGFEGLQITQDFILKRIALHYLDRINEE